MESALNRLSLYGLLMLIKDSRVSAFEVATDCVNQILDREPRVKAFSYFDPEAVLEVARCQDNQNVNAALQGIPIGVKDIIDVKDWPSTWGSAIYADRMPHWDASCVALTRTAGANIFGKTVTTEFAYFYPGKTVNPHNPAHTPGRVLYGSGIHEDYFKIQLAVWGGNGATI